MATYDWNIYKYNGTSWVELTNVQGLSFRYGQKQLTDTWSPPVWTITGRLPNENGTVLIGDWIAVIESGSPEFIYQVTNYEVFYGIKSSMDTWTMTIETAFSALGRSLSSCSWLFGPSDILAATNNLLTSVGLSVGGSPEGLISDQTITNENGLDVFSRLMRTSTEYTLGFSKIKVPFYTAFAEASATSTANQRIRVVNGVTASDYSYYFTDSPTVNTQVIYDGLNFGSLNLNFATKVVVNPEGLATQTVGSGNTAFETGTYSRTTGEALEVANRYAALLSASQSVPLSVTFTNEQQNAAAVLPNQVAIMNGTAYARIAFRGADYYATIIGQELTSLPGSTRVTLSLCASENSNFFTLDSASLGVLDQNRLGI